MQKNNLVELVGNTEIMIFPSPNIFGLWIFIVLGLLCSIIGYVYNRLLVKSLDLFKFSFKNKIVNSFNYRINIIYFILLEQNANEVANLANICV